MSLATSCRRRPVHPAAAVIYKLEPFDLLALILTSRHS
jgi:hypothetical protein